MKSIIVFTIFLFAFTNAKSQVLIQSEDEFNKDSQYEIEFEKKLKAIKNNTKLPKLSTFNTEFYQSLNDLQYKLYGDKPNKGALWITFYVNQSSEIERVVYRFDKKKGVETPSLMIKEALDSLRVLIQNTKWNDIAPNVTASYFMLGLRIVKVDKNKITTVEELANTNQPDTIKTIAFNQLKLKEIPASIYKCVNAVHIDLSQNELKQIHFDLSKFPKLKNLVLTNNKISELDFSSEPNYVEEISLGTNVLEKVNFDFSIFKNLKNLTLTNNKLNEQNISLTKNSTLKMLNIQQNLLTDVPLSVQNNLVLESLWLGGNDMKNLSDRSFENLKSLKDLNLYRCNLKSVPRGISKLKKLEILDLYYNELTELPASIRKLRKLNQLAIAFNHIAVLPKHFGRKKRLHTIYAHHNKIAALPNSFKRLKNLRILDLNHNWIALFPEVITKFKNLEELDLSHNNLTELSPNISNLLKLQKIFLTGNPISERATISKNESILKNMEANKTEIFK